MDKEIKFKVGDKVRTNKHYFYISEVNLENTTRMTMFELNEGKIIGCRETGKSISYDIQFEHNSRLVGFLTALEEDLELDIIDYIKRIMNDEI